jgi:hypothetical protein
LHRRPQPFRLGLQAGRPTQVQPGVFSLRSCSRFVSSPVLFRFSALKALVF